MRARDGGHVLQHDVIILVPDRRKLVWLFQ